jgi:hypothetical protein
MVDLFQHFNPLSHNNRLINLSQNYKNDSRIGPVTKVRCDQYPAFAQQTYETLSAVDSGKYIHSIAVLSE